MKEIRIRTGTLFDMKKLQELSAETIVEVCNSDYNEEQIQIWVSTLDNSCRWYSIFTNQLVLVAHIHGKTVGFCTLDNGTHIDLFYVHKDYQRCGIAQKLFLELEKKALENNQTEISVEASLTAKPFFEKIGFRLVQNQTVVKKGVEFINFMMKRKIY